MVGGGVSSAKPDRGHFLQVVKEKKKQEKEKKKKSVEDKASQFSQPRCKFTALTRSLCLV